MLLHHLVHLLEKVIREVLIIIHVRVSEGVEGRSVSMPCEAATHNVERNNQRHRSGLSHCLNGA